MNTKQTKPFAKVTDKKVATATKQVPAPVSKKPAPAKTASVKASGPAKASVKVPAKSVQKVTGNVIRLADGVVKLNKQESKAFHGTKSMDKKTEIVAKAAIKSVNIPTSAKKAIVTAVVKQAKAAADTAVAKANLAKAVVTQVKAKEKLKAIDIAIKKTGADTKGYKVGTAAGQKAMADKREASMKKVVKVTTLKDAKGEPAKKPVKVVAKTTAKPATRPTSAVAVKSTTSGPATSPAGSSKTKIVVHGHRLNRVAEMNKAVKTLNLGDKVEVTEKPMFDPKKVAKAAAAAPKNPVPNFMPTPVMSTLKLPATMTDEQAQARAQHLRKNFTMLAATMGAKRS